jgi:hypothetical protein
MYGFTPSEDLTFALAYGAPHVASYMESSAGSFGTAMMKPTSIQGAWSRVILAPGGDRAFLTGAAGVTFVVARNGEPANWTNPAPTNLPTGGLVGRPTADGSRIVVENQGNVQEYVQTTADGKMWSAMGPVYTATTFGHLNAQLSFPSLSADGQLMIYVVKGNSGNGVSIVERDTTGVFLPAQSTAILITASANELELPVLVGCKRVYAIHTAFRNVLIFQFP